MIKNKEFKEKVDCLSMVDKSNRSRKPTDLSTLSTAFIVIVYLLFKIVLKIKINKNRKWLTTNF